MTRKIIRLSSRAFTIEPDGAAPLDLGVRRHPANRKEAKCVAWIWWLTIPLLHVPGVAWAQSNVITPGKAGSMGLGRAPNMAMGGGSSTTNVPFDMAKQRVIAPPPAEPSMLSKLTSLLPDFQVRKKPVPVQGALPTIQYQGKTK